MTSEITQDEALYFLVFATAAQDHASGWLKETVDKDEWDFLQSVSQIEHLQLSDAVKINRSLAANDDLTFHGMRTETYEKHKEGANKDAFNMCCEVLRGASLSYRGKAIFYMFHMALVTHEGGDSEASSREIQLIQDTATELGITDEDFNFIVDTATEDNISALAALDDALSGTELLDELVSLDGIGEKTAFAVMKAFKNSREITMASEDELVELDSVSIRNAVTIKERF